MSDLNETLQILKIIENNRYILFFNYQDSSLKDEIISKIRPKNFEAIKNNQKVYFSNLFLIFFFLNKMLVNKSEVNKK